MACQNPKFIDTANVNYFGFNTVFNPYSKNVVFDIDGITTFKTGGEANITSIVFTVTDADDNEFTGTINPSIGGETLTLTGLSQGALYFGQYHIEAVLTEADASTYTIEFDVNVCYDSKLNNANLAVGCALIDVNCNTAKMVIKEGANLKYAGKEIDHTTTLGTVNYPIDPETQAPFDSPVQFNFTPYSLDLTDAITGVYTISLITTVYYDLGCQTTIAIQYRSNVIKEVTCGNGMCELTCCLTEAADIIVKGGSKGAQMEELMPMAMMWYGIASQLANCGKNNDKYVKLVKETLNCDCKCDAKSLLIQPNPITFGAANLIGECGITITEDENGDYVFHAFNYRFEPADGEDKISFQTVQINDCTRVTYATIDCEKIEECIYDILANNPTILNQWKILFGIKDCPCTDVDISNTPELVSITTQSSDYFKLAVNYFVKSDVLTGVNYKDHSVITGGTLSHTTYFDQLIQQMGLVTSYPVGGQQFTLPAGVCGSSLADKSGYKLISIPHSTCGCEEVTECDLSTPQVEFSERYEYAYRWNPHMSLPNYIQYVDSDGATITHVYFNDVKYVSPSASNGGFVRKATFRMTGGGIELVEVRTLSGRISALSNPVTYNNNWGDVVEYDFNSSVNIDTTEIVNGEPVIYFNTFGGVICRLVRERDSECDERANWKTYVIGGLNTALAGTGANGLAAGSTMAANAYTLGTVFHGMKTFIEDENGHRTFMLADFTSQKVFSMWYGGSGSKNSAANWVIGNPNIALNGDCNINCEFETEYDPNATRFSIWSFGTANGTTRGIRRTIYAGANTHVALANNANYTTHSVCVNASAGPTTYNDGTGDMATIASVRSISKVGDDKYYFCTQFTLSATAANYLRYFEDTGGLDQPSSYTFDTEIVPNNESPYSEGTYVQDVSSGVSGANEGLLEIDNVGVLGMFFRGMRFFDFPGEEVTVFSGQEVANGDLVADDLMDSQYEYLLENCQGGSN